MKFFSLESQLVNNTKIVDDDCRWCNARNGVDVHSAFCPHGERSKQIQELGGIWRPVVKKRQPSTGNADR